ncbi:PREDICTED: maltase A2 isoform X2 [Nicrophorus vespilloides]|uniref:alpha-glucosidase n=1 Tax=Nicrophorus vespilloides TaxID=110193 RepID=A0ABM1M3T9_NICVS|nr:PREDICTED: maltase A2 isoform X2 [Nicrophorus vespilloides]
MEGTKLEISGAKVPNETHSPTATYKQLPENDMEDQVPARPKSLIKETTNSELDGADERMLPDEDKKLSSNINIAEVKFTSNDKQNGDAKLDIGEIKTGFVGMGKEELMKYANDPFWVRLRWFLFILFWALWAGMLVGAVMIIVSAPKCDPPEPKTWWEEGPLTEVSLGDTAWTVDDLKLLKDEGFTGVIIPYPGDTYKQLNATGPFMAFLNLTKKLDINVIVDLKPSVSQMWLNQSATKDADFANFYIWSDGSESKPPNNWLAKDSNDNEKKTAWTFNNARKQFYFSPEGLPHLNFREPAVVDKFTKVLEGFLDAGVKGIRLNGAPNLLVNSQLVDETPKQQPSDISQNHYDFYMHTKTEYLPELGDLLKPWRHLIKNKTDNAGVFMLAENLETLKPFKVNSTLVVDLPKHSNVFQQEISTAENLKDRLDASIKFLEHNWPMWQVSNESSVDLSAVAYLLKGSMILNKDTKIEADLKEVRKSASIIFGSQQTHLMANRTVFAYVRVHSGNPGFIVAVNPTDELVVVDFLIEVPKVADEVTVQYIKIPTEGVSLKMKHTSSGFPMAPHNTVVLSYVPKSD